MYNMQTFRLFLTQEKQVKTQGALGTSKLGATKPPLQQRSSTWTRTPMHRHNSDQHHLMGLLTDSKDSTQVS